MIQPPEAKQSAVSGENRSTEYSNQSWLLRQAKKVRSALRPEIADADQQAPGPCWCSDCGWGTC